MRMLSRLSTQGLSIPGLRRRMAATGWPAVVRVAVAVAALLVVAVWVVGCGGASGTTSPTTAPGGTALKVLAVETFLTDIAQNVVADHAQVQSLLPLGVDPHSFEPTPADIARVAECDVLIVNGAGFEPFLDEMLKNAGGRALVVEAAAGLTGVGGDPHFWLDPTLVVKYAENIRDGLSTADPPNAAAYAGNAAAYIAALNDVDVWIKERVAQIPPAQRLLVTNHESLGYFARRYGFTVVGTIMPSVSTGAAPSAQQLAGLVDTIKRTGARAIFLETGSNPQLAEQVAAETGVTVVTELYSHSITEAGGGAPTYLDMMRANTLAIVGALK
jgi:ABC-type Zn uptake system ZnuABC Zn-binding protein ZnuA